MLKLLEGGSNSPVAIAVGNSEGTRYPDGGFTPAWYGHQDPGNQAHNQGSFSYQHESSDPNDADLKQIQKIKDVLLPKFLNTIQKVSATQIELRILFLVACDLFTQSEIACIGTGGFLEQIEPESLPTISKIIDWRFKAYHDPVTGRLDAPGLGNDSTRVTNDQTRRTEAVINTARKLGLF